MLGRGQGKWWEELCSHRLPTSSPPVLPPSAPSTPPPLHPPSPFHRFLPQPMLAHAACLHRSTLFSTPIRPTNLPSHASLPFPPPPSRPTHPLPFYMPIPHPFASPPPAASPRPSRFLPQPMVARAACRLLGDYAQWFGRSETGAPVEGAVSLLLHCLPLPSAQQPAAHAIRNMCVRCSSRLSDPAVLLRLMDSAAAAVAPVPAAGAAAAAVPLGPEERAAVVEGLARLASALPSPTNGEAGLRLIQPLLQRAQSLAQTGAFVGGEGCVVIQCQELPVPSAGTDGCVCGWG